MDSSAIESKSNIVLQYHSEDFDLKLEVKYGIDWKKGVKVHDEPVDIPRLEYYDEERTHETSVTQVPDCFYLTMQHEEVCNLSYKFHGTQDCEVEKVGLLEDFVKLPVDIMKTVRFITFYLLEKDTNGVHLVPQEEELSIRKVDEHEGTSTFSYRSNPVMDKASRSECHQIKNFVGSSPGKRRLMSVLWLLSEFAVKCFGKQDLSSKKPKQG